MPVCREVHGRTGAAQGKDACMPRSAWTHGSGARQGCLYAAEYKDVRERRKL